MNTNPDAEISAYETEAELSRRQMTVAAFAIREKLTPSNMWHRAVGAASERGTKSVDGAKRMVRRNPVAVGAAGGLGGLLLVGRFIKSRMERRNIMTDREYDDQAPGEPQPNAAKRGWSAAKGAAGNARDGVGSAARSARDYTSDRYHAARDYTSERYNSARDYGADKWERTREASHDYADRARIRAERARERANEGIDHNPLTATLLGLAAGVAIGALLPRSRREDRLMGEASDRVADRARAAARAAREAGQSKIDELGVRDHANSQFREFRSQAGDIARSAKDAAAREAGLKHEEKDDQSSAQPQGGMSSGGL